MCQHLTGYMLIHKIFEKKASSGIAVILQLISMSLFHECCLKVLWHYWGGKDFPESVYATQKQLEVNFSSKSYSLSICKALKC